MANTKELWKVVAVNIKTGKMEEVKFKVKFKDDCEDSCVQDIIGALENGADEFDGKLIDEKTWSCSKRLGDEWLIDASKEYYDEYREDEYFIYDWNTAKLVPADADVKDIKAPKVPAKLKKVRALMNKSRRED